MCPAGLCQSQTRIPIWREARGYDHMFHHGNLQGFKLFLRVQTFKTPTPFRQRCGVSSSISALKTLVSYPLRPSSGAPGGPYCLIFRAPRTAWMTSRRHHADTIREARVPNERLNQYIDVRPRLSLRLVS